MPNWRRATQNDHIIGSYGEPVTTFVNPYNFISLPSDCPPHTQNILEYQHTPSELHTGYLTCTLETLTPVFIPNTTNNQVVFDKQDVTKINDNRKNPSNRYDFFSYCDLSKTGTNEVKPHRPIIPGSSLRGVLRSAYEIVENGCLSTVETDGVLYKRSTVPMKPGILIQQQDRTWRLQKADRVMLKVKDCEKDKVGIQLDRETHRSTYPQCSEVYIQKSKDQYEHVDPNTHTKTNCGYVVTEISNCSNVSTPIKGYILWGENFIRKHHDSVMVSKKNFEEVNITDKDLQRLEKVCEYYALPKINRNLSKGTHTGYPDYYYINDNQAKTKKLRDIYPVFYRIVGTDDKQKIYLSPSCFTKEVFKNTIGNALGEYKPCTSRNNVCPSCALFGLTSPNDEEGLGSRIRITDAVPSIGEEKATKWDNWFDKPRVLPELSSPKISSTEFYMDQPKGETEGEYDIWNYDYAVRWQRNQYNAVTSTPEVIAPVIPHLKGRKMYWHSKEQAINLAVDSRGQYRGDVSRCSKVRAVKTGKKFIFHIYFDGITKIELKKLYWTITLGESETLEIRKQAHKIGHGKPVGLGSVRITVNEIKTRRLHVDDGNCRVYSSYDETKAELGELSNQWISEVEGEIPDRIEELLTITDYQNSPSRVMYPLASNNTQTSTMQWFAANKGNNFAPQIRYTLPTIPKTKIDPKKIELLIPITP